MAIKLRHQRYWLQVWVPEGIRAAYGNRRHIEKNLETSDRKVAEQRAATIEGLLRAEFAQKRNGGPAHALGLRQIYEASLSGATAGEFMVLVPPGEDGPVDPKVAGIDFELDKLAEQHGQSELTPAVIARVAALNDASETLQGRKPKPRHEYEPTFSEIVDAFMGSWKAKNTKKETNTEQQKRATFRLFQGFWDNKPIRKIAEPDAAAFHDALIVLDPLWARKPGAAELSWTALIRTYGNRPRGLSDATINRHLAALKSLWDWARRRGFCSGDNPFDGFHRKLKAGDNVSPYLAWTEDDLNVLLNPPPRRRDLLEVMLVALHTGMRLDEIASLTWSQIREEDGIRYFQVEDAKTPAGNRQVPIHSALSWLLTRTRGEPTARLWPQFNLEGPGKKAGADAGRDFSRFKSAKGFRDRSKAFHSFRKSVTRIMERAGVPQNEWATVFGHERGFTYGVYNPDGISIQRKAVLIELIDYPRVKLPAITAQEPPQRLRKRK